jgi:predicted RNA-binding protein YlqC (UPF0109 family)
MKLSKREMPDRSKIELGKPGQAKLWASRLGISQEQLGKVIEKVGNSAAAVKKQLEIEGGSQYGASHR